MCQEASVTGILPLQQQPPGRGPLEMNLIIITALVAVTGAAKLDRTYLPPASAKTAGGSPGALQAPAFEASNSFQAPKSLEAAKSFQAPNSFAQNAAPKGSYTNEFQGVVVDAALAGTRDSGPEASGLGGPRNSYGSTASKVGDAAFRGAQAGFRFPVSSQDEFESNPQFGASIETDNSQFAAPRASQNFGISRDSTPGNAQTFGLARETPDDSQVFGAEESRPERPQAAQERAASTLRFDSEVGPESFNYAFETDNGISAEESGIATNGVQAQGGFSYTGDDGKVYTVTYTADEGGYQPRGDHLPTPPPIPEEILRSLEQNARDEANGVVDDGFYDAQKYNEGGDYAESDSVNGKQNGRPSVTAVAGNSDVDASGSFISQNNIPFNPNNQRQRAKDDKPVANRFQSATNAGNGNVQGNAASGNRFGSRNEYLPPFNNQNRPQSTKPQAPTANADADSSSTFQQESTDQGSGDFESQPHQAHSHTDSTSFATRPTENRFNAFQQSESSNRNQFNQNGNRFPSSQGSRQQFAAAPMNSPSNNGQQQFSAQSGSSNFASQQATSVPDTELTTPFESTPQKSNGPTTTNSFGLNSQSSRPGQSQFGFQNIQKEASQAPVQPTIPSFAQSRPQNINNRPQGANRNTQAVFSSQSNTMEEKFNQQPQFGNNRPQFQKNQFSQNRDNQFSPSTQKPQIAHQSNAQDDSYYYNQPSKTFNIAQSQSSRFPSSSSNQFNRVTQRPSSFTSQVTEEENYPSTPSSPPNGQRGSTKYPRPPTLPTKSTPSNNQYQSKAIASASNGITQASVSSFAAPTTSTGFNRKPFGQPRQQFQQKQQSFHSSQISSVDANKPFAAQTTAKTHSSRGQSLFEQQNFEAAQPLSQQPLQDVKQPKLDADENQSVINQQYNGEIYEYIKPAETLPPPESGFGQFGTKVQSSKPTQSRPQFSQTPTAEAKPIRPSFGQSNGFEESATGSQDGQIQSQSQFGQSKIQSERPTSTSFASKPMRFGQSNKASQHDQFGDQTSPQEQATNPQFNAESSSHYGNQEQSQSVEQPKYNQFEGQRRPSNSQIQGNFASATAEVSRPGTQNRNSCCNAFGQKPTFGQVNAPSAFEGENQFEPNSSFQGSSELSQEQSQSVAGKGEVFGGPRKPPSFDESGYHY